MTAIVDTIDARHMGRSFATDKELVLPLRPRLIPELMVLPIGDDGLMFVGAEEHQILRGRTARGLLPRLLPLFDGTRTLDEIVAVQPAVRRSDLHDIVSLLFSRGLLEDGRPEEPSGDSLIDTAAFLARHVDVSRRHPNREAALRSLATMAVRIVGPLSFAHQLATELRISGVGDVFIGGDADDPATLTILISTGEAPEITACPKLPLGNQVLLVRLGRTEAHIGPLLIEGLTACPECVAQSHPHPSGHPDALQMGLWLGLASLYAFLALSQLPAGLTLRGFRVERMEDESLVEETRLAVRLPGCPRCGIPGERWAPDDPRLLAWIYHCATSLPSRAMLSPKDHQGHYLVAHTKLATEEKRLLWAAESHALSEAPPAPNSTGTLGAATLALMLSRIAGEVLEDGSRRRLVPTGGNLGSVTLWVIVRSVRDLAPGAYLYDASRHALDFVGEVDDDSLRVALRTTAALPECLIVGTGALAKCAQKYQAFAYRLIHLDAGVALGFAHLSAAALGLSLREYPDFDLTLPSIYGIPARWEFPLPTFVIGIGSGTSAMEDVAVVPIPAEAIAVPSVRPADYSFDILARLLDAAAAPPAHLTRIPAAPRSRPATWAGSPDVLDRLLQARRSVRDYARTPIAAEVLRLVTIAANEALSRRRDAAAPDCFLRPVLGVALSVDGLPAGLYEFDSRTGGLQRRGDFSPALAAACSNQESLAAAPATLYMIGNLRSAIRQRGTRGYVELALFAGSTVGEAWLRATSLGLVGVAAGGVIAAGLRTAVGMDGFHECPLLALHLGQPARPDSRDR